MFRRNLKERKNYIANAASKVFAEKGYETASLQDIALKADITKAGIYYHFKAKEEILYYILESAINRFIKAIKDCIAECREKKIEPEAAFRRLIFAYANFINSEKELPLLVLRERHQLKGKYKEGLYKKEQEIFHTLRNELNKIDNISGKFDPNVVAYLIIAVSHWMGYWVREDGKLTQDQIIDQYADLIFHGILKK